MKVGIYTDSHFSLTSSIDSAMSGYRYSSRLDMLVKSFEWMYEQFRDNNVEFIINAGDLCSSDILRPEENSALFDALSYNNTHIPEYHILGNHERKDKNRVHHSISLLKGYDYAKVIEEPTKIPNTDIMLLPYVNSDEAVSNTLELFEEFKDCKYLVSHVEYIGVMYGTHLNTEGFDPELIMNITNISKIFNGHIHTASCNDYPNGQLIHIGQMVGSGFNDNYNYSYPGIMILDTETGDCIRIGNPYSSLYYKLSANSVRKLSTDMKKLNHSGSNRVFLRVDTEPDSKDNIRAYVEKNSEKYGIISSRVRVVSNNTVINENKEDTVIDTHQNISDVLYNFAKTQSKLPDTLDNIKLFIDKHIVDDKKEVTSE